MSTTTYHLVVVKSVRDATESDPVHTAKKVELAVGKLAEFAGKDEVAMITAFQRFVNGEAGAEADAEAGTEEPAEGAEEAGAPTEEPVEGAEEPGFE